MKHFFNQIPGGGALPCENSISHSPQPLGWDSAAPGIHGNHFNGFPQLAIPSHTA